MIYRTACVLCIAALLHSAPAVAQWRVESSKDPMTDEVARFASVSNKTATLYLYERDGEFIAGFRFHRGSFKTIHYDPKQIAVRVDKNEAQHINYTAWEPDRIFFKTDVDLLDEFTSGSVLRVQYRSNRHTSSIEVFSLAGATNALRAALPSYMPKAGREKMTRVELDKLPPEERAKAELYMKDCPKVWAKYRARERITGQPQLWQGCSGAY